MNLVSPSEHQLLVFWVSIVLLVAVARLLGLLARRVGQPAVIGELSAGLVLGPSVLGRAAPDAFEWLFPADDVQSGMLFTVGWLGVVFLLVVTGYETDLGLIRRLGKAAGIVSTGSLVVPMLAGFAVGIAMPSLFLGQQEEALQSNVLVRDERLLLPSRGGINSIMAAQVLDLAWPEEVPVTLIAVDDERVPDLSVLHDVLHGRAVDERLITNDDPAERILSELTLGYGVAVVGANGAGRDDEPLLSPFTEELARRSPVPVLIVRRGPSVRSRLPAAYGRVLVPVAGTPASLAAQEVGLNISASIGTEAVLAHVVHHDAVPGNDLVPTASRTGLDVLARQDSTPQLVGRRLLDEATEHAERLGARSTVAITSAQSTASGILELAAAHRTDLVILGTTRRDVEGRLFIGHGIERLLRGCDATVVVVVTPPDHHKSS